MTGKPLWLLPLFLTICGLVNGSVHEADPALRPGYEQIDLENCKVRIHGGQISRVPKSLFDRVVRDIQEVRQWLQVEPKKTPIVFVEYGRTAFLAALEHLNLNEVPAWVPALALPSRGIANHRFEVDHRNPP